MSQARAADPETAQCEHFHPLEIIPFFHRVPWGIGRDFLYTFIWNGMFGVFFYSIAAFAAGRLPSLEAFGLYVLVANIVGYSIHLLFTLGAFARLDVAARRRGFAAKVAYSAILPMAGVLLGMWLASFIVDVGFRGAPTHLDALLQVAFVTILISIVLSAIFFWRERSAVANAALAHERARIERVEREAALANLRALQAQIEPHFLFNTLANVTSLIDPDPAKAKGMLESFIRFLRASLDATRMSSTTLGDEGALIGAYLEVLKVRMGARLRYRIEVDPDLATFALPPMLLQPLVENAIRHGLEPKVEGGEVCLRAHRENGNVAIEIADTGVGFAPVTRGGVGLENLRSRLKLLYGERASLAICESAAAGTRVRVTLPA